MRLSTARRLLLEALFAAEGPVGAELLAGRLSLDAASVYRNLEALERHGLLRHVHLGHGPGLYVLAGRGEGEYLYCDRCGNVKTVKREQLDPIRVQLRQRFGYEASFAHFPIVGLCRYCANAQPIERKGEIVDGEEHSHEQPHTHAHAHDDETHKHPHTTHDHDHTEHEHEHSHGDRVHSHEHLHEQGLEDQHEHEH